MRAVKFCARMACYCLLPIYYLCAPLCAFLSPFGARFQQTMRAIPARKSAFPMEYDWRWRETNFNRIALVNLLSANRPDGDYLEIGCADNDLLDSVLMGHKIGVDPARGGTVRKTSDEFFESNDRKFDVIFIDGLHSYEQVRRDVMNSIKCLKQGGWIALHDMLPGNWIEEHVPIISIAAWTGDVWKVAFELSRSKGIDFRLLKIDHGVGVFRLTDNDPRLYDLTHELRNERFAYLYNNLHRLPLVELDAGRAWIRGVQVP